MPNIESARFFFDGSTVDWNSFKNLQIAQHTENETFYQYVAKTENSKLLVHALDNTSRAEPFIIHYDEENNQLFSVDNDSGVVEVYPANVDTLNKIVYILTQDDEMKKLNPTCMKS